MIRKLLIPVVFVTFLVSLIVSCTKLPAPVKVAPPPSRDVAIARLDVTYFFPDGSLRGAGHCTAFKVGVDTIATAGHCCDEELAVYSLTGRHSNTDNTKATKLYSTAEPDVCILRGEILGEAIPLAGGDPDFGAHVWTVGYPAQALLMSDGYWTGRDEDGDGMCSVVVIGGASGSPVMDDAGQVIGILVKGDLGRSHNITYLTGIEHLIKAIMLSEANSGPRMFGLTEKL